MNQTHKRQGRVASVHTYLTGAGRPVIFLRPVTVDLSPESAFR